MEYDRLTPVEKTIRRNRRIRLVVIILLIVIGIYYFVFNKTYVDYYQDEIAHFNHGSIGSESANGLPYWIFQALPDLYEDKLGGKGWSYFGFHYANKDDDLPIGFSKRRVQGISRTWLNCAGCHTGSYIDPEDKTEKLLFGAPANDLRLLDFIQFFREVATDTRFNADNVLQSIENVGGDFNFIERLIYRYIVIDRVRTALLDLKQQLIFLDRKDLNDWGPGRVDTFNPYKAIQFNFPMDQQHMPAEALNGASDYPSLWMQRPREGMQLHWDGNNVSVAERNLSAALGAGVTPVSVDRESLLRIKAWSMDFPPPEYPLIDELDQNKVSEGHKLYSVYCADCHGKGLQYDQDYTYSSESNGDSYGSHTYATQDYASKPGDYPAHNAYKTLPSFDYDTHKYTQLGNVIALAEIGTDPGRYISYTENFAGSQNLLYVGYPWRFSHFRKTEGYANHPLDGIWARSPYLHNGSVPTLRDLLEPSTERPKAFYRGSKHFDWIKVGYQSYSDLASSANHAPEVDLFLYDTTKLGNSNSGHEGKRYGTYLSARQKDAIVEYMKTL